MPNVTIVDVARGRTKTRNLAYYRLTLKARDGTRYYDHVVDPDDAPNRHARDAAAERMAEIDAARRGRRVWVELEERYVGPWHGPMPYMAVTRYHPPETVTDRARNVMAHGLRAVARRLEVDRHG